MNKEKYVNGLKMNVFKRIDAISNYNHNYYIGFDKDLLFGLSDDINITEWWIVEDGNFIYLGESSSSDLLRRYKNVQT